MPQVFLEIILQTWHTILLKVLFFVLFKHSWGSVFFQGWILGSSQDFLWVFLGQLLYVTCHWNVNLLSSLRSWTFWKRFSLRTTASIFPFILNSLPLLSAEKHPLSLILPPKCLTVGMVIMRRCKVPGFLSTSLWKLCPRAVQVPLGKVPFVCRDCWSAELWWFSALRFTHLHKSSLVLIYSDN